MELKELIVNYKGSGVKTLKGFGVFFFVTGVIALLVALIGGIFYLNASLAGKFFPLGIILLFFSAVCVGLLSIAKMALYKRSILEEQYYILDSPDSFNKLMKSYRENNNYDAEIKTIEKALKTFYSYDYVYKWKERLEELKNR
jgi:hypothetical protein